MTTKVTVEASCSADTVVQMSVTDNGEPVELITLRDGESADRVVYDGREITVWEMVQSGE